MPYPHQFIKLTDEEEKLIKSKLIEYTVKKQYKKHNRIQALWLSGHGWTFEAISRHERVSYRTVKRWISRYRQKGLNAF